MLIDDLDAYLLVLSKWSAFEMIFLYFATWSIVVYQFGIWVVTKYNMQSIKQILFIIYYEFTEITTSIGISPHAKIGNGMFISHIGGLVIAADTVIGANASFHQWVTVGGAGRGEHYGVPNIGDNAYFGAGAKVIGGVKVGNNVMIGANAVVVKDVPDNAVVGGAC
jgi:serine O-acetyltransferase